jgi:hypothetical protein
MLVLLVLLPKIWYNVVIKKNRRTFYMKNLALILTVVMLMTVVGCGEGTPNQEEGTPEITEATTEAATPSDEPTPTKDDKTDEVNLDWIDAYRQEISKLEADTSNEEQMFGAINIQLYDMNDNGIPELFVGYPNKYTEYKVYTFTDGKAVETGKVTGGGIFKVSGYDGIYTYTGVSPYGVMFTEYFELKDNKLTELKDVGINLTKELVSEPTQEQEAVFKFLLNDTEISQDEYLKKQNEYFSEKNQILQNIYPLSDKEKMFANWLSGETPTTSTSNTKRTLQSLNLRKEPSLEAEVLMIIPGDEVVELISDETIKADGEEWVNVKFNGVEGFASINFLE